MNLQVQILLGKSVQSSHEVSDDKDSWVIGRGDGADIHLAGDRIALSHALLKLDKGAWTLVADQGQVKLAGERADEIHISQLSAVSIGPYLLKFNVHKIDSNHSNEQSPSEDAQRSLDIKHPRILVSRLKSASGLKSILNFKSLFKSKSQNDSEVKSSSVTRRRILLVMLLVLTWTVVGLKSCGSQKSIEGENRSESEINNSQANDTSAVDVDIDVDEKNLSESIDQTSSGESKALSLDDKRIADRYIQWANQLQQENEVEQAFLRLQAGHQKFPEHDELKQRLSEMRDELVDNYRTTNQFDKALDLVRPYNEQDEKYTALYQDLLIQQETSKNIASRVEAEQAKLIDLTSAFKQLTEENKFDQARQLLAGIDTTAVEADRELKHQYEALKQLHKQELQAYNSKQEQQHTQQLQSLQNSQASFLRCLEDADDDYKSAFLACEEIQKMAVNNYDVTEAQIWMDYLSEKRYANTRELLETAETCFAEEKFNCAFGNWSKILVLDPEYSSVKERFDHVLDAQLKTAQRLYQTAKAYEDLGQISQAKSELKNLMEQLPLPDQSLYKKARELYDNLEQF